MCHYERPSKGTRQKPECIDKCPAISYSTMQLNLTYCRSPQETLEWGIFAVRLQGGKPATCCFVDN